MANQSIAKNGHGQMCVVRDGRKGMKINISQESFGLLCVCAIRYCQGRQTYMPSLVQRIVRGHLKELSDNDLAVMLDDCEFQERMRLYGDERIDKPDWLRWKEALEAERDRRRDESM